MNKSDIQRIARGSLSEVLNESGSILYSSHQTLRKGDIYLLGFNPGGTEGDPLNNAITDLMRTTENAYLDQNWSGNHRTYGNGQAPLQKRVVWLLGALGFEPSEVCATNRIFLRSRSANTIPYKLADLCWPVHQAILSVVQPKLILAFGNGNPSPYLYLRSRFGSTFPEETFKSGHGNWQIKGCSISINGEQPIYLAGVPHLSYYSPIGKDAVVAWLKGKF
jgi:hypothetical protein